MSLFHRIGVARERQRAPRGLFALASFALLCTSAPLASAEGLSSIQPDAFKVKEDLYLVLPELGLGFGGLALGDRQGQVLQFDLNVGLEKSARGSKMAFGGMLLTDLLLSPPRELTLAPLASAHGVARRARAGR